MTTVSIDEAHARFVSKVREFDKKGDAAEFFGITPPALSDMLHRHRGLTDAVLVKLGLARVQMFKPIEEKTDGVE
jgi:hypothetical protein